ncbi:phosphatidate cytidylyltransferase [Curvivirga sp.]|uniref:phosphatidate cytidylyltransferase n=1 Tax=Curvivirga sp. TaxID=2856848 RepID=UPI003B5B706B
MEQSPASPNNRWADLPTRIVSALVILPVSLACIWVGGEVFLIFLTVLSLFCAYEWCRISGLGVSVRTTFVFWFGILLSFLTFESEYSFLGYIAIAASTAIVLAGNWDRGKGNAIMAAMGVPYLVLAFITCFILRDSYNGVMHLAWLVGMVVATDIGAYASGRTFGGPKIAPKISPKKTWAGLVGGIIASVIVTIFFYETGNALVDVLYSYGIAVLIPIVAQSGDFLESWMKRRADVKDSSSLIPGHGGFLDRLDGFLAALPVFTLIKSLI